MSSRAAEMLKDDMESRGPVKLSEVETAQKEILAIARKLADAGTIQLGGAGAEAIRMSGDILEQDEIDALLHGVDSGAVDTDRSRRGPAPSRSPNTTSANADSHRARPHADARDDQRALGARDAPVAVLG